MTLPASARYGIPAAPAGLDVVQDLLNTASAGRDNPTRDVLADVGTARPWVEAVATALGLIPPRLTTRELTRLRDLRSALRDTVHRRDGLDAAPGAFDGEVALHLRPDGRVDGESRHLADAILLAVYTGQARDDWRRLKLCALDICDLSFYDRTKNTSARYHTPRCANLVNLHNSRARKRGTDPQPPGR